MRARGLYGLSGERGRLWERIKRLEERLNIVVVRRGGRAVPQATFLRRPGARPAQQTMTATGARLPGIPAARCSDPSKAFVAAGRTGQSSLP
jgi:hypothetical protein